MTTSAAHRRRIAVVGMFDSKERDKLAMITHGIQQAGHIPVLVDAELFVTGRCRFGRTPEGQPSLVAGDGVSLAAVDGIRGNHRSLAGTREQVVVDGVCTVTADLGTSPITPSARVRTGTIRPADSPVPLDAVWPEALDISRRLEFECLYRGLVDNQIPSLAGTWESVLNATFKHRMRAVLGGTDADIPQPQAQILHTAMADADIERARERMATPDVWLKAPNDSHSHGIRWLPAGESAAPAARKAMRETPDGILCLMEEDVCGILEDRAGRQYRADLAVTVLDHRAIHANLRVQPRRDSPTNSIHGGRSLAIAPSSLPGEVRRIAVDAVRVTGSRYGSVDILGGLTGGESYRVVHSPRPMVCEVNKMPGGRSPGFLARVIPALVGAYLALLPPYAGGLGSRG